MSTSQKSNYGHFLPVSHPQNQQELFDFADNAAHVINTKTSGWYTKEEVMTGEVFFPSADSRNSNSVEATYRQIFRKVIEFGALPDNTTKSVPHGIAITNATRFVYIYGTANDPVSRTYKPIPHSSPTASNSISLDVDDTNIIIETGANLTAFTDVYITLGYTKQV